MSGRLTHYYPRALTGDGGVTNAVWLWAESLHRAGVEVEILHAPVSGDAVVRSPSYGVRMRPLAHIGHGRLVRPQRLGEQLDGTAVLILHSGYVLANLVAGREARRHGVPYVVVPHGAYDPHVRSRRREVRSVWEIAERRLLRRAAAIHLFLPSEIDQVRSLAPLVPTVRAPTAFPVPASCWSASDCGEYLAWLGRYDIRHKGLDLLLDAMALVPTQRRPRLVLRGRDSRDSRRDVQAMVTKRGLDGSVEVGPPVEGGDKESFLLGAAAYVHPSRWESYGVALVEAMAYGVPCLTTTDVGLGPSLAAAGAARVVAGTAPDLARGLETAASAEHRAFGTRGRAWVGANLSHEASARRLVEQLAPLGLELR